MQPENQRQPPPFAVTLGEGRTNPQGIYQPCEPTAVAVAEILRKQPSTIERWWSMHLWLKNRRKAESWLASSGIIIDIDYRIPNVAPPTELVERLQHAASINDLPGNFFHLSPHGGRIVFVYESPCTDRELQKKAERGAGMLVSQALEKCDLTDYQVDSSCLGELARYFYTPDSIAKGVKRSASIFVMREDAAVPETLAKHDVPVRVAEKPAQQRTTPVSNDQAAAIENWNNDHPGDWPRRDGTCPICQHNDCFGTLPEDPKRWHCFSTNHIPKIGVKGAQGYHGDPLDIEAHQRGCKPVDVLRKDGYLRLRPSGPPPRTEEDVPPEYGEERSTSESDTDEEVVGYWRSHSYSTAVGLIKQNYRNILENKKLELNEMSGDIEVGRKPIKDADAHRIRYLIEKNIAGGVDKKGNQVGLQLSSADIFAAITQVANEQPYHPVKDYLSALKWDGSQYISKILNILGAQDTEINQIIIKRFFVSAVARALEPGCKVDTVFILIGKQGSKKSSFFRALTDPWFVDTTIDIGSDPVRAYMTMRKAWILEWAELESLFRAKNASTVKAFLSSPSDSYVPKHARYSIEVKRSGVIVGSINPDEFLSDDTGHRRFWPLVVGNINLDAIITIRDQLWAEAVHLFQAGERWWLTEDEEKLLAPRQSDHEVSDVWAVPIMEYVLDKDATSVQEVLGQAIRLEMGQWADREMKRVCRILKASGEWKPDPNKVKGRPRLWVRTGGSSGVKKDEHQ